jgi:hypothetical protein
MSANLTIRIDEKLKRQVEAACVEADITVSQVIRAALRDFVKKSGVKATPSSSPTFPLDPLEPDFSKASIDRHLEVKRERLAELAALEKKNLLNKVTRRELENLRHMLEGRK